MEKRFSDMIQKVQQFANLLVLAKSCLSPCPFSQSSFRTDSYSNEYLLAKIGFDTAENEPFNFHNFSSLQGFHFHRAVVSKARAKQAAKKASPRSAAEEAKVEVAGIQTLQFMSSEISSICERCTLLWYYNHLFLRGPRTDASN